MEGMVVDGDESCRFHYPAEYAALGPTETKIQHLEELLYLLH